MVAVDNRKDNNWYIVTMASDWSDKPYNTLEKYPQIKTIRHEVDGNTLWVKLESMFDLETFIDMIKESLVFGKGVNGYWIRIYDAYME